MRKAAIYFTLFAIICYFPMIQDFWINQSSIIHSSSHLSLPSTKTEKSPKWSNITLFSTTAKSLYEGVTAGTIAFIVVKEPSWLNFDSSTMAAIISIFEAIPCIWIIKYSWNQKEVSYDNYLIGSLLVAGVIIFGFYWKKLNRIQTWPQAAQMFGFIFVAALLGYLRFEVGKDTLNSFVDTDIIKQISSLVILSLALYVSTNEYAQITGVKASFSIDPRSSNPTLLVVDVMVVKGFLKQSTRVFSTVIGNDLTTIPDDEITSFNTKIIDIVPNLNVKNQKESDKALNYFVGRGNLYPKMTLATSISIAKAGASLKNLSLISFLKETYGFKENLILPSIIFNIFSGGEAETSPYKSIAVEFPDLNIFESLLKAREVFQKIRMNLNQPPEKAKDSGMLAKYDRMYQYFDAIKNAVGNRTRYEVFLNARAQTFYRVNTYVTTFNGESKKFHTAQQLQTRYRNHHIHDRVTTLVNGFYNDEENVGLPEQMNIVKVNYINNILPQADGPFNQILISFYKKGTLSNFFTVAKIARRSGFNIIVQASPTDSGDTSVVDAA